MEVAVFGGTFDPPTYAHEGIMRACLEDERFDQTWVMLSGARTDKDHMSSDEKRLQMLRTLRQEEFADDPRLVVSDFELRLPRPTITYLTYTALRHTFPDTAFWFIYGADSYLTMESWEYGRELKRELPMIIVPRARCPVPPETDRIRHIADLPVTRAGISSTLVRDHIKRGLPVDSLMPASLVRYITEQQLYKVAAGS